MIPPDRSLAMQDGHLVLGDLERNRGRPVAIDTFLCTLAQAHGERAIGVVLSGRDSRVAELRFSHAVGRVCDCTSGPKRRGRSC